MAPCIASILVSQAIRIFPRAHARRKGGGGRDGKIRLVYQDVQVFVPSAGMLAEPMKFEHSK